MGNGITIPFLPVVPNKAFQFCSVYIDLCTNILFFIISCLRYGVRVVPCFKPHVTTSASYHTMYILLLLISTSQPQIMVIS